MKRNIYDKSCYNAVTGVIGKLQTIFNMPVIANETTSIRLVASLRLSQLKRWLTMDARVDMFAFFVPHRHCYDDDWVTMVKQGAFDSTTLDTIDCTGSGATLGVAPDYLGAVPNSSSVPAAYVRGYNAIYETYFRPANITPAESSRDLVQTGSLANRKYGRSVAKLPTYWNTGNFSGTTAYGAIQNIYTDGTDTTIDLLDIKRVQAEFRDEVDRAFFENRYADRMERGFGANGVHLEAEETPELLAHQISWLSGYDVDSVSDAGLGQFVGKSQGIVSLDVPPKYFKEHGMIWVMACLRYPPIMQEEKHYLVNNTWTYDNVMGDPNILLAKQPHTLDENDFTGNGQSTSFGLHPYAQWYRTQPNRVHSDFHGLEGYPFWSVDDMTDQLEIGYEDWGAASSIDFFVSEDLGHWNMLSKAQIESRSIIPSASQSLYAGANL